jgi:hypothetical protein
VRLVVEVDTVLPGAPGDVTVTEGAGMVSTLSGSGTGPPARIWSSVSVRTGVMGRSAIGPRASIRVMARRMPVAARGDRDTDVRSRVRGR